MFVHFEFWYSAIDSLSPVSASHDAQIAVRHILLHVGGLLEYESVMEALKTGKIGALGADVMWSEPVDPDHEIFQHPK